MLIFFSVQVFSQCYPGWERCMELSNKGKYDRAISACHENLLCDNASEKAGALLCLMNIYTDKIPDDSLYLDCKRKLVELGYEYPIDHRTVFVGLDGVEYEPPRVDLYVMSRELCCELYDRGEADSALYYFEKYALRYHEKGWCGLGRENNGIYDELMWARLYFEVSKSDSSLTWISGYLDAYKLPGQSDVLKNDLAIFCFYDLFHSLHPDYRSGQLLTTMEQHAKFHSAWKETMMISVHLKNINIYLTIDRPAFAITDTMKFVAQQFRQTLFYHCIQYKDMIASDSIVSFTGRLSDYGDEVVVHGPDRIFYLEGISELEEATKYKMMTVTGKLVSVPKENGNAYWINSSLMQPQERFKWTIKNPVLTFGE